MKKIFSITALGMFAAAFSPFVVFAQTASQIRIQPALVEERVNPGDTYSSSILVTNPDPYTKSLQMAVQDISGINDNGTPIFTGSAVPEYGMSSWMQISQTPFTLKGGESKEIPFVITVPKDAPPGGHYGGIFVVNAGQKLQTNGSGVGYEVGTLVDLRIAGEAKEAASIVEFSTDKLLYQTPAVTFTARVHNDGNVLLHPRGPIEIVNMFGKHVGTVVMNDQNGGVFPGSDRGFTVSWNGGGLAIGRYEATMSLGYGDTTTKTISAATVFWVLPLVPIAVVLGGIIVFIALFVFTLKWYIRKRLAALSGSKAGETRAEEEFLYQSRLPFSRLLFVTILTVIFTLVFLVALFVLFG